MFLLHETTRRRLARAGFLLLCLAPTLSVAGWAYWLGQPGYRSLAARGAGDRLGLAVSLGGVSHPRPGATLLEDFALADPETGVRLARARLVEIETDDGLTTITLSQLEIFVADGSAWWDLAQRELRRGHGDGARLRIAAGEVILRLPSGDQTLTQFRCQSESSEAGSQLGCSFRVAGYDAPEPATLALFRNRQTSPAAVGIELHTGDAALGAGLLAAAWPPAVHLGREARFRGSLRAVHAAAGWQGELAGELQNVDLDDLVTAQFPHKLGGRARIELELLRFEAGRIESATGSLAAGPGLVGRSLLKTAADSLGLEPAGEIKTLGRSVPYDRLALAFVIDRHGLALRGQCPIGGGAILQDSIAPLALEPKRASQPVANLVRSLAPSSEAQIPATRESSALAAILPAPSSAPPTGGEDEPGSPHARIRLRRPGETLR